MATPEELERREEYPHQASQGECRPDHDAVQSERLGQGGEEEFCGGWLDEARLTGTTDTGAPHGAFLDGCNPKTPTDTHGDAQGRDRLAYTILRGNKNFQE
jgi:hypothetical protein